MKRILYCFVLISFAFSFSSHAQSTRSEREKAWRMEREKKRAEERAIEAKQDSVAFKEALQALQEGSWVLEANNVIFSNGLTRFVSSSTNYISLNEGLATVQTAFNNFVYSPNGLGGVTLQGNVSGARVSRDKDGNVYYSFSIQGIAISATVYLTITGGTNQASASINPNFSGRTMTMNGYLYPYSQSTVFQGTPQW